jgi:hypothetical protein
MAKKKTTAVDFPFEILAHDQQHFAGYPYFVTYLQQFHTCKNSFGDNAGKSSKSWVIQPKSNDYSSTR